MCTFLHAYYTPRKRFQDAAENSPARGWGRAVGRAAGCRTPRELPPPSAVSGGLAGRRHRGVRSYVAPPQFQRLETSLGFSNFKASRWPGDNRTGRPPLGRTAHALRRAYPVEAPDIPLGSLRSPAKKKNLRSWKKPESILPSC